MPYLSSALEAEIAALQALRAGADQRPSSVSQRRRCAGELHFMRIIRLLDGRIRHLIRAYGLGDMTGDARQACAIGVHRALESYDPTKARFTTHVTWQMRGELQGLRHRMRLDQRASARKLDAQTVSLDAGDGEGESGLTIVDEGALARTESGASDTMARNFTEALVDEYARRRSLRSNAASRSKMAEDRAIFMRYVMGGGRIAKAAFAENERERQVRRRVFRNCAAIAKEWGFDRAA